MYQVKRHAQVLFVQRIPVAMVAVLAERLAVIARHDHQRGAVESTAVEVLQEAGHRLGTVPQGVEVAIFVEAPDAEVRFRTLKIIRVVGLHRPKHGKEGFILPFLQPLSQPVDQAIIVNPFAFPVVTRCQAVFLRTLNFPVVLHRVKLAVLEELHGVLPVQIATGKEGGPVTRRL